VQDGVDGTADVDVLGDVCAHEPEIVTAEEMLDIRRCAGEEVVEAENLVALVEETFTKVRAKEAGTAGDHGARSGDDNSRDRANVDRRPVTGEPVLGGPGAADGGCSGTRARRDYNEFSTRPRLCCKFVELRTSWQ
jgi:hypothetical protein